MKTSHTIAVAILFVSCVGGFSATLIDDLGSSSQKKRDAAAKSLRATYIAPPRTNWDSLLSALKVGTPKTNVLEELRLLKLSSDGGVGSGNTETEVYRLDDLWTLECSFINSNAGTNLSRRKLTEQLRDVWVEPPPHFTGDWITYYANGQVSHQGHYKDGQPNGQGLGFHPNGSKAIVHHTVNGVAEGEETGFHPSGNISYKGSYKAGAQSGIWIWYNEDGSIQQKRDYSKRQ